MDKPMPSNPEAERAVLGSILLDRDAILSIAAWLKPTHFCYDQHALIYAAMYDCYQRRIPPDLVNVHDALRQREKIDQVGGMTTLTLLSNSVPTAVHVEYYARIVEQTAVRRSVIQAGKRIAQLGYDEESDLDTLAGDAQIVLTESLKRLEDSTVKHIGPSVERSLVKLTTGLPTGMDTGFLDIDDKMGGLHRSRLYLLAGPSGSGKTSLADQILYHYGTRKRRSLMFSLEMTSEEIGDHLIALHSGIRSQAIAECRLSSEEALRLADAVGAIYELPIFVSEEGGLSAADIRLQALRYVAEHGPLDLVIVDYLQLIVPAKRRNDNPAADTNDAARAMKRLAQELKAPVLALSQMNREGQKRNNGAPQLYDLLYGGDRDADAVLFLTRADDDAPPLERDLTYLHVPKNRHGPKDFSIPLRFDGPHKRFQDVTRYKEPAGYGSSYYEDKGVTV